MRAPNVISLAIAGLAVAGMATPATAAPIETKTHKSTAIMLAVQSETSTLAPATKGRYTLTMNDTDPLMAWFADRPVRRGGAANTSELIGLWNKGGKNSFKADPPNAAITVHEADGTMEVMVATLRAPQYDATTKRLTFTVKPLNKKTPVPQHALNVNLGATSVFIDSTGAMPIDPTPDCSTDMTLQCELDDSL